MSVSVEAARQQWQEGYARFLSRASESENRERLYIQLETVNDELRRRIGQTYTLAEAAGFYYDAERWAAESVAERLPKAGWSRDLSLVLDAAFCLYARGAVDYLP